MYIVNYFNSFKFEDIPPILFVLYSIQNICLFGYNLYSIRLNLYLLTIYFPIVKQCRIQLIMLKYYYMKQQTKSDQI